MTGYLGGVEVYGVKKEHMDHAWHSVVDQPFRKLLKLEITP